MDASTACGRNSPAFCHASSRPYTPAASPLGVRRSWHSAALPAATRCSCAVPMRAPQCPGQGLSAVFCGCTHARPPRRHAAHHPQDRWVVVMPRFLPPSPGQGVGVVRVVLWVYRCGAGWRHCRSLAALRPRCYSREAWLVAATTSPTPNPPPTLPGTPLLVSLAPRWVVCHPQCWFALLLPRVRVQISQWAAASAPRSPPVPPCMARCTPGVAGWRVLVEGRPRGWRGGERAVAT